MFKLNKKQFKIFISVIFLVNITFISGIIISYFKHTEEEVTFDDFVDATYDDVELIPEKSAHELEIEKYKKTDNQGEIFGNLFELSLPGTYAMGNDLFFTFYTDGTFAGYFDEGYPNVEGYKYEVVSNGSNNSLVIKSPNDLYTVVYNLSFNTLGGIELIDTTNTSHEVLYTLLPDGSIVEGVQVEDAANYSLDDLKELAAEVQGDISANSSVVPDSSKDISFTIGKGDTSSTITKKLADLGLISDEEAFDKFLQTNGYDTDIKTGTFMLKTGMTNKDLANALVGINRIE